MTEQYVIIMEIGLTAVHFAVMFGLATTLLRYIVLQISLWAQFKAREIINWKILK